MPAQSINTNISTDRGDMSGGTVSKAYALCVNLLEMYGEEKIEQILKDEELECPSLGLSQD
jgi:hypothetical protein